MNKSKKYLILTALICIALGLILTAAAFYSVGFHISGFNTVQYEAELIPLDKPYDKIVIDGAWCDVIIMAPGTRHAFPQYQDLDISTPCVLSYNDGNDIYTEIGFSEDKVLNISRRDLRPWYEKIGINVGTEADQIVLFLDDLHFDALEITTSSGRFWLMSEAEIKEVQIHTSSGELFVRDLMSNSLTMKSTSGDIYIQTSLCDQVLAETTSGEISLSSVHAQDFLHAMTSSGKISANMASASNLTMETTSGEIEFSELDAIISIVLETTSGDIEGSLSSGKRFTAKSTSGSIHVPSDAFGGAQCIVTTTSGDIEIKVE